jgi:hypothetical protein
MHLCCKFRSLEALLVIPAAAAVAKAAADPLAMVVMATTVLGQTKRSKHHQSPLQSLLQKLATILR